MQRFGLFGHLRHARAIGSALLGTVICALSLGACSSAPEEPPVAEDAVSTSVCPANLLRLLERDEERGWFTPSAAQQCVSLAESEFQTAREFEGYLATHPFVRLDKPKDFVTGCVEAYEKNIRRRFTEEQKIAAVSSYYLLMNTMKQQALATLEGVAGIDMLIDPLSPVLPPAKGVRYAHPHIHESGDWERRLQDNCEGNPQTVDAVVGASVSVVWNVRKLNAAILDSYNGADGPHLRKMLNETRDAVVNAGAPWLVGKEFQSLFTPHASLARIVDQENSFDIVDAEGKVRPKDQWKPSVDYPLRAIEKEVRDVLPKQLKATRALLMKRLEQTMRAAEYLHAATERGMGYDDFVATVGAASPFNPKVFFQFYTSKKASFSLEKLDEVEAKVRKITSQHVAAAISPWLPTAGMDTLQRLSQMDQKLAHLASLGVDTSSVDAEVQALRRGFADRQKAMSSFVELSSAECRRMIRPIQAEFAQTMREFAVIAGITVATMGLGGWMSAARAAVAMKDVGVATSAFANAGRAWAARGVSRLAQAGLSYERQAKVAWTLLLAGDVYWLGDGVVMSVVECNRLLNDNMLTLFDVPFDLRQVSCRETDAMAHQAIADYKGCVIQAGLSVALNAIALLPTARHIRHGALGPK